MSIGLAFAQGLIGGFTKNIDREGAVRQSDDLQFADLQKTVTDGIIKASASGNPFPKELGSRLQAAKTAMDKSRTDNPIGLFGTGKSDRLNLNLTDLSGLMNGTNGVNKFGRSFGTGDHLVGFQSKNKYDASTSTDFLSEAVSLTRSPKGLEKLQTLYKNNKPEYMRFLGAIEGSSNVLQAAYKDNPKNDQRYQLKIRGTTYDKSPYFGIDKLWEIGGGDSSEQGEINGSDVSRNKVIKNVMEQYTKKGIKPPSFITVVDNDETTDKVLELHFDNDRDKQQALTISKNFKVGGGGNVFDFWHNKHVRIPGLESDDKTRFFKYSVKVGTSISDLSALDPDMSLDILDGEQAANIFKKLRDNTDGSVQGIVYALSSYMNSPNQHLNVAPPAEGSPYARVTNPMSKQEYVSMRVYGKDRNKGTQNFSSLKKHQDELTIVVDGIGTIISKVQQLAGEDGLGEGAAPQLYNIFKNNLKAVFSLDGGVFGGVINDFTGNRMSTFREDADDNRFNEKTLTSGYLKELAMRNVTSESGITAQIQALRITLAFQMARAADPSGRLSNQDIEQQMAKLGSTLSRPAEALDALTITFKDFKSKQEKYELLIQYGSGTAKATDSDYRLIDAVVAYETVKKKSERYGDLGTDRTNTDPSIKLNPNEKYEEGGVMYDRYLPDGDFYIDQMLGTTIPKDRFQTI